MAIFLVTNRDGDVLAVAKARTFEKAYKETIALNQGEMLVKIRKQDFQKISELFGEKKQKTIDEIWQHIKDDESNPTVGDFHQKANSHIKRILLKYGF